jgi:hypothetical protein
MANPIYQIRRLGRVYVAKEGTYGSAATLAATDAVRHLSVKLNRKNNAEPSKERFPHPSLLRNFKRRKTYDWSLGGLLYPSGTIATPPDMDPVFECGFGAISKPSVALVTTVAASPTPTTTVFTVASATGLAVGQGVLCKITGGTYAGNYIRVITAINTLAITVSPALPQAPASGDTIKSGYTYRLATLNTALSLDIAHYLANVSYEGLGCVVQSLKFTLDANDEIHWEASGNFASRSHPAQTDPATQTLVGTAIPSGLTGYAYLDGAAQEFLKASIEVNNNFAMDNKQYGLTTARGGYRVGQRSVKLNVNVSATDDATAMTAAEGEADHTQLIQTGESEGNYIGFYMPAVNFEVPDDSDGDGETEFDYAGTCKGVAGNDELCLVLA